MSVKTVLYSDHLSLLSGIDVQPRDTVTGTTMWIRSRLAPHIGRTRYMKCPECGKWSYQKKVLTRE